MSPDINRIVVLFLLVGSALAVSASLLLMRLYRNAVQRRMSSFGRKTVPGPEPTVVRRTPSSSLQVRTFDDTTNLVEPDTISPAYRRAMQRPWQTAAVYTAAGTCYAVIVTVGWLAATHDRAILWTKVAFLFWLYLWPTVIAIVLVVSYNPARLWRLCAGYFLVLLAISGIALARNPDMGMGQLLLLWLIVNGLPTVIMLVFLLQPIRAVGRVVFLVDATTDLGFLKTTLQRLWQNLSADSPNQAATKPRAQFFPIVTESERELGGLLRLLMGQVPATAVLLMGVSGPVEGKQFAVKKHGLLIGRNPKNDLAIPQDEHVSASHAYLRYEQGGLLIVDRNSRNGTFVNDSKLTDTGCVLTSGDRIRIGNSTFEVRIAASAGLSREG